MNDLERVVAALRAGDVVVLPTDTVYGLVASAADRTAVTRIFALKHRPVDTRVAVLVADVDQALEHVVLGDLGRRLAARFWPGALTIVGARVDDNGLEAGDADTLGVRCPADVFVREVAAVVGPLAATSANHHGGPTLSTAAEIGADFPEIAVVVDDGPRSGEASTVVSVVSGTPMILREGAIAHSDISAALTPDS